MRSSRIIAAVILSTILILALAVNTFAASITQDLDINYASLYYKPLVQGASPLYDLLDPRFTSSYTYFDISNTQGEYENYELASIQILMFPADMSNINLERGYIYTFDFTIRFNKLNIEPQDYIFGFGVANEDASLTAPLGDAVFTYNKTGSYYEFYVTFVVNVEKNLDFSYVGEDEDLYYYLDIIGSWSDELQLRSYKQTVTKAVGEEAYYQASLDAINGLPQSEYDFVYNSMPDSEGEAQVLIGDIEEMYAQFNPWLNQITTLFSSDVSRPCLYIPEVVIPFLDIKVFDSQIFYVDDYLNNMNADILPKIEILVWFVRFVGCVTFVYYTYYKVVRIEWWC